MSRLPTNHTPPESCTVNDRLEKVMTAAEITYTPAKVEVMPPQPAGDETTHHPRYSPSSMERIKLCPASVRMCEGLPELPKNEDATEGTLLHRACESGDLTGLDYEQKEIVENCLKYDELDARGAIEVHKEFRLTLSGSDFKELTFGTCDYLAVFKDKILIKDKKFGRNEVAEPANNYQFAAYAVAASQMFGISTVACKLEQPRIGNFSEFTFTDIPAVLKSIEAVITRANGDELIFNPCKKACQYCRAKVSCFALQKYLLLPDVISVDNAELLPLMPDYLAMAELCDMWSKAVKAKAKEIINDGNVIQGWTLKPGNQTRKIKDFKKCYGIVTQWIPEEKYLSLCVPGVGDIEKEVIPAWKETNPKLKIKDAKKELDELLESVIERAQNEPSLARDKEV